MNLKRILSQHEFSRLFTLLWEKGAGKCWILALTLQMSLFQLAYDLYARVVLHALLNKQMCKSLAACEIS